MGNLLNLIAAGAKTLVMAAEEMDMDVQALTETMTTSVLVDWNGLSELLIRFLLNTVVIGLIVRVFYYPKSKRRDYFVTFILIAISIFLIIYLMGGVKLKTGVALGLFAIFGIIRYRTEQISIREMTYLFVIMGLSVINGLATTASYTELIISNAFFVLVIWALESRFFFKQYATKLVLYEKIDLIVPEKEKELIEDLKKRTGLDIRKVQVGHIDFLRDVAYVKVVYSPKDGLTNDIDQITKEKEYTQE
jgi:hypothetical protein